MKRLLTIVPVLAFAALAFALWLGLSLRPRDIPSALIGKPVPEFALPGVGDHPGLASADFKSGEPRLLNVFASWCAPCRIEHPVLMELAKAGVMIDALAYKDQPADATKLLIRLGNPYQRVGDDRNGRVAIEFGVYGVPESYVITGDGKIAYKHVGVITADDADDIILPMIKKLKAGS